MEIKEYNPDNLLDDDIDFTVTRVKALVINDKDEILVSYSDGGIQLVGGHVEEGEELHTALKREIEEEAGITLDDEDTISECFYKTIYYQKNYKESGKNRKSIIYCFLIKTNKTINEQNIHHTQNEVKNNLHSKFVSFEEFFNFANEVLNNSPKELNRVVAREILGTWKVAQNLLTKNI